MLKHLWVKDFYHFPWKYNFFSLIQIWIKKNFLLFLIRRIFTIFKLENKPNKTCEYQPDELDDNSIENDHKKCLYSRKIKLMISGETMRCRKVRQILRYHVLNKLTSPEEFAHHVILLFFSCRDEKQLLSDCSSLYQNKVQEQGVQDVVNRNKIKFKTYGDLGDLVRLFLSLMRNRLTIKIHIAKLKIMKH